MNDKYGTDWTREELVLALYLYCQIPFAKTKANNPEVIRLADLIGRTPSSVARKLGNFGAFDPILAQKGISGLGHYSKADEATWKEFNGNWDKLVEESGVILEHSAPSGESSENAESPPAIEDLPVISRPVGPTNQQRVVNVRLYQSFFRRAVLSSYQSICCICSLDLAPLLVASHIIPWAENEETRTDPENGLCLCALHDKAFDRGLISITTNYKILISSVVRKSMAPFVQTSLAAFANESITLPIRFAPHADHLQWHLNHIFQQ